MIAASALLLDTQTQHVFAQLKIQSVVSKPIDAVCVEVEGFDPAGSSVLCNERFWFRDLYARFSDQFGQKSPIRFKDDAVRSFTIHINSVVFTDGDIWNATELEQIMQLLPNEVPTIDVLGFELADQYTRECKKLSGKKPIDAPAIHNTLVFCACGALYTDNESACPNCRIALNEYLGLLDKSFLHERLLAYKEEQRIEAEKAIEERRIKADKDAEEQRLANEMAAKKQKYLYKRLVIILPILIAVIGSLVFFISKSKSWKYDLAEEKLSSGQYLNAIEIFISLGDYKDASELVPQVYYLLGEEQIRSEEFSDARDSFSNAGNYSDAYQRILETYYLQGEQYLAEFDFTNAIDSFKAAKNFSDAGTRVFEVNYVKGTTLLKREEYSEAYKAFQSAGTYKDAAELKLKTSYMQGNAFLEQYQYDEAINAFNLAGNYQDAKDRVNECYILKGETLLENTNFNEAFKTLNMVGYRIVLGSYEQDNNQYNGKEPISWIVLAVEDDKMMLLSEYCLDCRSYNDAFADITWEGCTLRKWLNGPFVSDAFSRLEKDAILLTKLQNNDNSSYGTSGGNETNDSVFLLSIDEFNKYVITDDLVQARHTKHAKEQWSNQYHDDSTAHSDYYYLDSYLYSGGPWRLRSPGSDPKKAAVVPETFTIGNIFMPAGEPVTYCVDGIRPAIWVDLTNDTIIKAIQKGLDTLA